jgi:hypothetical protein
MKQEEKQVFNILPIKFCGSVFDTVEVTQNAAKHHQGKIIPVFSYIASTLDGQNRDSETDKQGNPVYQITSNVGQIIPDLRNGEFRDTRFTVYEYTHTIKFLHCAPRRKKQFENKFSDESKKRIE